METTYLINRELEYKHDNFANLESLQNDTFANLGCRPLARIRADGVGRAFQFHSLRIWWISGISSTISTNQTGISSKIISSEGGISSKQSYMRIVYVI